MVKNEWPTPESWLDLSRVVGNLEVIVDDASSPGKAHQLAGGGLLGMLGVPFGPEKSEQEGPPQSRLAAEPDLLQAALDRNLRADLERVVPGISALGGSRPERLEHLRHRLVSQPAYAWLTRQPGFLAARETTAYLAKRGDARYAADSVDFKLIAAASLPLLLYRQGISSGYPTRGEIEEAAGQAEALSDFMRASGGLVRTGRLSFGTFVRRDVVAELAQELRAVLQTKYRRPKPCDPSAEMEFGIELVVGLKRQFGSASPKIVSHFLNIIEFVHDEARVGEVIQRAEARGVCN
jgi:hypothetical protein